MIEQAIELGLVDKTQHLLLKRLLNDNAESILNSQQQQSNGQGDNTNDKKKKQKIAYPTNKYSQGIPLVEAILIDNVPYFLSLTNEDKKPVLYEKIELTETMDIVPPEHTEYLSKEYSFKSQEEVHKCLELARNETLDSLFYKVANNFKKFIDMDDDFINILAADAVFTYFQDRLGMTHYLLIVGDNNTGKSNILQVFSILGYRAVLDTSITSANIYNYGGQLEIGQITLIEDELGDIDEQFDKKKLYQSSYTVGKKVSRMYDNNNPVNSSTGRKSSRQQGFFLYCFKMFASEKMPDKTKSKGFLERIIPLKALPGYPLYDISEIVDDSGDEEFTKLNQELHDTRKLLLMYRLLHFNDKIPNLKLNVKNRYKQLTKPLIRIFQNSKSLKEVIKALSKYVIEKNKEKIDSLDSAILSFIIDLIEKKRTPRLFNFEIWKELKENYPDGKIEDKPYSWYLEGLGTVSKNKVTDICEQKFGAVKIRDEAIGRGLFFDTKILNKVYENYSIIDEICIIEEEDENEEDENQENKE